MFTIKINYAAFGDKPESSFKTAKAAVDALCKAIANGGVSGAYLWHNGRQYSVCEARKAFKLTCPGLHLNCHDCPNNT